MFGCRENYYSHRGRGSEREDGSGGLRGSQTLSYDATAMNRAGEESETSSTVGSDCKGACPHTRGRRGLTSQANKPDTGPCEGYP